MLVNKTHLSYLILLFYLLLINTSCCFANYYQHDAISIIPANFNQLPGWIGDDHQTALYAFQRSCKVLLHHELQTQLTQHLHISSEAFKEACLDALALQDLSEHTARVFFQKHFTPVAIAYKKQHYGFFTGYYTPVVRASVHRHGIYQIPIYARPDNLTHHPYYSRAAINAGKMKHHAKVLLWTNSLLDRFFLQMQGSGIALLENGHRLFLAYAGSNHRHFTGVGQWLYKHHFIKKPGTTYWVKNWLATHAYLLHNVINQNQSFIFYHIKHSTGINGAHNVLLTPRRSMAVDLNFIPFGTPLWVSTYNPSAHHTAHINLFQHLLIAQDAGSAVRGPIRGDIYWGSGASAELLAGNQHNHGRYWLLLPRSWVNRFLSNAINPPLPLEDNDKNQIINETIPFTFDSLFNH